eukprot:RCo037604
MAIHIPECCSLPSVVAAKDVEYSQLRKEKGDEHPAVLEKALDLSLLLLGDHSLAKAEAVLDEAWKGCEAAGGAIRLKALQCRAYCLYKRFRHHASMVMLQEVERINGPRAYTCEVLGRSLNFLGEFEKAEKYLSKGVESLPDERKEGKLTGSLAEFAACHAELRIGLSVALNHGKADPCVVDLVGILKTHSEEYGEAEGTELALGKIHSAMGRKLAACGRHADAIGFFQKAVECFSVACGRHHPTTVVALSGLGQAMQKVGEQPPKCQKLLEQSDKLLCEALLVHSSCEAVSLSVVIELVNSMVNQPHSARKHYRKYIPMITTADKNMRAQGVPLDQDFGVFCKYAAEIFVLAEDHYTSLKYLLLALELISPAPDAAAPKVVKQVEDLIKACLVDLSRRGSRAGFPELPVEGDLCCTPAPPVSGTPLQDSNSPALTSFLSLYGLAVSPALALQRPAPVAAKDKKGP